MKRTGRIRPAVAAATAVTATLALAGVPAGAAPEAASYAPAELLLPDAPGLDGPVRLAPDLAAVFGTDTLDPHAGLPTVPAPVARAAGADPALGTTRFWPVADFRGPIPVISLRPFTLRALGTAAEAWVAAGPEGTAFAAGDCRNARPAEIEVTPAQAKALVREFDKVIYPRETKAFSVPVERDGTRTVPAAGAAGLDFSGSGKRTVLLVDNIRDAGFDKVGEPGVSGFFTPLFSTLTDRNIVTVDSFDWRHRTGDNPPDDRTDNLCTSRSALPRYVESTVAHEWYHLLSNDADTLEPLWVEEGMAEYAMSVAGYPKTRRTVSQPGAERELLCFQGYGTTRGPSNAHPVPCGGPQNSLTRWEDEGAGHELLADYGNAWSFMLFLADRYGPNLMRALHRNTGAQGLTALQVEAPWYHRKVRVADLLHDFRLMNLLDRLADTPGSQIRGIDRRRVTSESLSAALDLANPAAYARPGAGPNGADYISVGPGRALRSLQFQGEKSQIDAADEALNPLLDPLFDPLGFPTGLSREPGIWRIDVVGMDRARARALVKTFGPADTISVDRKALAAFAGYPEVVLVVAYDRVFGRADEPGRYTLSVNGSPAGA